MATQARSAAGTYWKEGGLIGAGMAMVAFNTLAPGRGQADWRVAGTLGSGGLGFLTGMLFGSWFSKEEISPTGAP